MELTQLQQLEECLNAIPMDDEFSGKRTARDVASLLFQRNSITNSELNEVEAALDKLVEARELDRIIDGRQYLYSSMKFGTMREEYLTMLQKAAEELDEIQEYRQQLIQSWNRSPQDYFTADSHWYHEVH